MSYLAIVPLLCLIPELCHSSPGDICQHPQGFNGDSYIEGCVKHTCKTGVWRPSIDKSTCCFNGEAFEFGSIITTVDDDDDCTTAHLECTRDGIETVITRASRCSLAKKIQVNHIKNLLKEHISEAGDSSCSNSSISSQEQRDVLLIGPIYSDLQSEIFTLPNFTSATCAPPVFPHDDFGSVRTTTPAGPLMCGGSTRDYMARSACYLLGKDGVWVLTQDNMTSIRDSAASVQTEQGWWVTGGFTGLSSLSSTEVWDGSSWTGGVPLPLPLYGHCMTRINTTHIFLVGGDTKVGPTNLAFIYSQATGWVQEENMNVPRYSHACGLHDDHLVIVAGGHEGYMHTTEFFDLNNMTWHFGPVIQEDEDEDEYEYEYEDDNALGQLFSWEGKTYWIGKKNIWELVAESDDDTKWFWRKGAELKNKGKKSQPFILKEKECKNW